MKQQVLTRNFELDSGYKFCLSVYLFIHPYFFTTRKAHSGGGQHQGIYLGHPDFEGFEVIL